MKRLLALLAALSFLLCIALGVLWSRSYSSVQGISLDFTHTDPYVWLVSNPGRLTFCWQSGKEWESPKPKFDVLGLEFAGSWVGKSFLWNLFVPYWMLMLVTLPLPVAWATRWRRQRLVKRRKILGLCQKCGYDLRETADRCPECGTVTL